MTSNTKIFICLLFLFMGFNAFSQEEKKSKTVFITRYDPDEKEVGDQIWFRHASISIPLRGNPNNSDDDPNNDSTGLIDKIVPNGISAHVGYGIHHNSWVGLSLNTGIDYTGYLRLVNVPVYASLLLNPHIGEDHSIIINGGYGYSFAIGRGDTSGTYQKYRLGLGFHDSYALYLEINVNNFTAHGYQPAANFSVGLMAFEFL